MKKQINVPSIIFSRFNEDSSWKSKKFKELLDPTEGIRRGPFGSALKKELFVQNSEYVVYEQQNAIYDHFNTRYRISEEKYHELKKFILLPGDFIMSGAGTIGKISLVPEGIEKGVFNQALIRLRVNKNTDKEFFLQWMRSPEMQNKLTKANPASAMVNLVPMSEVKEWDVIVPSLEEQSAIGSLFRTLDDLLASYKDNLANYQSLKATMLSKMFPKAGQTVPDIRLDGFDGEWERIKLGEFCDLITKGTTAKSQSEQGKVNFVKVENLKDNEIYPIVKISEEEHLGSLKRSILCEGDILFSIAGTLGRTAIVRNNILPANTNQALAIIRGYKLDAYFLLVVLSGEVVKDYIRKNPTVGAQPNLSLEQVSSLKIQAPSMEEQQAIGAYFSNLDNLIAAHQEKISQLETLKKKLLQDMFI
ncbi:restriction endonuclease subunit S [Streptococcus parasanguinis]|uniref:restriction endonuclease subunit S n=1 Tax=Streptococcus parasanguinis TaxID=1318 RepID=UPI00352F4882